MSMMTVFTVRQDLSVIGQSLYVELERYVAALEEAFHHNFQVGGDLHGHVHYYSYYEGRDVCCVLGCML